MLKKKYLLIFLLFTIAFFLRFYNLNWGAPFYFHPDERNIANSVSQLHLPNQLNPHFFAYGSFPIYIFYVTGIIFNLFAVLTKHTPITDLFFVSFEHALLISRLYAAILSTALLFFLYKTLLFFLPKKYARLFLVFPVFSIGFLQYAHFGTFEMWLTFFSLLFFYLLLLLRKTCTKKLFLLLAFSFGLLCSIKVSSLVLFPLVLLLFFTLHHKSFRLRFFYTLLFPFIALSTFLITNPFAVFDYAVFRNSMQYESSVVLGTLPVFYTGGFVDTIPILFSFLYSYLFLFNPFFTVIFIFSFFYLLFFALTKRSVPVLLLLSFFLLLFLPQTVLYAKWTRYLIPSLPAMYIAASLGLYYLSKTLPRFLFLALFSLLVFLHTFYVFSFFKTVYLPEDTRVTAATWASEQIPSQAVITSEVYDLGIVPFNTYFPNITLFNFYDLDTHPDQKQLLGETIQKTNYITLPSQRVIRSRLMHPHAFPNGATFYNNLQNGTLGFTLVYKTPCDIFCTIIYNGDPLYHVEETVNIFDRPTVFIYEKKGHNP
jgi:4-amino-4-deoxy-L-arabinose transferase-like glycosyltransferase